MKKNFKLIGIIIIVIIFFMLICILEKWHNNYEFPNELHIKMSEINNNKSLIGLLEEEVVELLGEPRYKYIDRENKKNYTYSAGKTTQKSFWGKDYGQKVYDLLIDFDENDKVEYTYIKLST